MENRRQVVEYKLKKNNNFKCTEPDSWPIIYHQAWFDRKFGENIIKNKIYQHQLWMKRKKDLKSQTEDEDWIVNLKLSKEDIWLSDTEEADHFIEHYLSDIRLSSEKQQRCEAWVKEHFS